MRDDVEGRESVAAEREFRERRCGAVAMGTQVTPLHSSFPSGQQAQDVHGGRKFAGLFSIAIST